MEIDERTELIHYDWAVGFLKRKVNPFRMKYDAHCVRVPNIRDDDAFIKMDDEFNDLLNGIGWEYKAVAIFHTPKKGGAFFAWLCLPISTKVLFKGNEEI